MTEDQYEKASSIMKALANKKRLQILNVISQGEPCVSSIEKILGISQPNISQNLSVLRHLGIVEAKRKGKKICYHIVNEKVLNILELILTN
ncbi:MAG: metalloregulator ArsR/SmtB family transcription factor [bacterium]